jgi:cation-transporting ATPase F
METILGRHWHELSAADVGRLLETSPDSGLDTFEIARRLEHFGPNRLTPRKGQGPLLRFLLQFHQPLIYILLVATLVTALLGEWVDSAVIFGVVLVNAVVGFVQEARALTAIQALATSLSSEATVVRAGRTRRIAAADLVPGDVVLLQSGDKVPADLRLIRTRELRVDESALTGESVPVDKHADPLERDTPLADRRNMAYSSTLVAYGTAAGIVVATGDGTEIGQISEMIATAEVLATPLTRKIEHFSRVLLVVILVLAAGTFAMGVAREHSWLDMFMVAVALAVGAIPEGLPAAVTIMLAIGVARMASRRAIIRRLPAVETLGSTTIICSDKTGTLTQNQMTVVQVFAGGALYQVSGAGYAPEGEVTPVGDAVRPAENAALLECLRAGLLCNDARLVHGDGRWTVEGDPTEGALIAAARKAGLTEDEQHASCRRLDAIPFESQHQYMATLHQRPDGVRVAYIKGSVERVLALCTGMLDPAGRRMELGAAAVQKRAEEMAAGGVRVLALARKELSAEQGSLDHGDVASDAVFLGLQGMIDPPRLEAAEAVRACQRAGIHVKMITGDHAITAAAIARQLGIDGAGQRAGAGPRVLTGRELAALSDDELIDAAERTAVFARVTPEHKLRLVEAFQARGHVVAMTGDGVNDAPALRRADIGIAMALGGTEVAREAAAMVLTDDNFATIEAAVEEGRCVFDNLLKFIVWTLPTNGGEALVIMLAVVLGTALPILPVHLLWVNMTTAVCLGLMLAFEPKERGIMERPPRDPNVPLLSTSVVGRIVLVSVLICGASFGIYEWVLARGAGELEARTAVATMIVMAETFYLLNCRCLVGSLLSVGLFTNWRIWLGIGLMLGLQLLFVAAPLMNQLFHTAPISLEVWLLIGAGGLAIFGIVELEKWLRRRMGRAVSIARSVDHPHPSE